MPLIENHNILSCAIFRAQRSEVRTAPARPAVFAVASSQLFSNTESSPVIIKWKRASQQSFDQSRESAVITL
ncbi:hypothetical protein SUGI_0171880 [Cryptomeria japonica]|nr:hypothetical protein SUGI_0171880 [Cryptomeria japonica]